MQKGQSKPKAFYKNGKLGRAVRNAYSFTAEFKMAWGKTGDRRNLPVTLLF